MPPKGRSNKGPMAPPEPAWTAEDAAWRKRLRPDGDDGCGVSFIAGPAPVPFLTLSAVFAALDAGRGFMSCGELLDAIASASTIGRSSSDSSDSSSSVGPSDTDVAEDASPRTRRKPTGARQLPQAASSSVVEALPPPTPLASRSASTLGGKGAVFLTPSGTATSASTPRAASPTRNTTGYFNDESSGANTSVAALASPPPPPALASTTISAAPAAVPGLLGGDAAGSSSGCRKVAVPATQSGAGQDRKGAQATRAGGSHVRAGRGSAVVRRHKVSPFDRVACTQWIRKAIEGDLRTRRDRSAFCEFWGHFCLAAHQQAALNAALVTERYRQRGMTVLAAPMLLWYIPPVAEPYFLDIRPSTIPGAGLGLFLREGLGVPQGTILCEYVGSTHPQYQEKRPSGTTSGSDRPTDGKAAGHRRSRSDPSSGDGASASTLLEGAETVDAVPNGGGGSKYDQAEILLPYTVRTIDGRWLHGTEPDGTVTCLAPFANDNGPTAANARLIEMHPDDATCDAARTMLGRVFFISTRAIEGGEEIFVPYGAGYWGADNYDAINVVRVEARRTPKSATRVLTTKAAPVKKGVGPGGDAATPSTTTPTGALGFPTSPVAPGKRGGGVSALTTKSPPPSTAKAGVRGPAGRRLTTAELNAPLSSHLDCVVFDAADASLSAQNSGTSGGGASAKLTRAMSKREREILYFHQYRCRGCRALLPSRVQKVHALLCDAWKALVSSDPAATTVSFAPPLPAISGIAAPLLPLPKVPATAPSLAKLRGVGAAGPTAPTTPAQIAAAARRQQRMLAHLDATIRRRVLPFNALTFTLFETLEEDGRVGVTLSNGDASAASISTTRRGGKAAVAAPPPRLTQAAKDTAARTTRLRAQRAEQEDSHRNWVLTRAMVFGTYNSHMSHCDEAVSSGSDDDVDDKATKPASGGVDGANVTPASTGDEKKRGTGAGRPPTVRQRREAKEARGSAIRHGFFRLPQAASYPDGSNLATFPLLMHCRPTEDDE